MESLIKNGTKKKIGIISFCLILSAIILWHSTQNREPSHAWISASSTGTLPEQDEMLNVSIFEIKGFPSLLCAMEDGDKYGHPTDAFYLNSTQSDELLKILNEKSDSEIKPYLVDDEERRYHFYIRVDETERIYSVFLTFQDEKPGIA